VRRRHISPSGICLRPIKGFLRGAIAQVFGPIAGVNACRAALSEIVECGPKETAAISDWHTLSGDDERIRDAGMRKHADGLMDIKKAAPNLPLPFITLMRPSSIPIRLEQKPEMKCP
jgi:hypothetical protein